MNKKASTFSLWIEMILFLVLFLFIISRIGIEMNDKYDKDYDLTMKMNLSQQQTDIEKFQNDIINDTSQGQSSMTDFGFLKLLSTPKILMQTANLLWDFVIKGNFITYLVTAMNLGAYTTYIIIVFKALYIITIGFLLLKLVLRIVV